MLEVYDARAITLNGRLLAYIYSLGALHLRFARQIESSPTQPAKACRRATTRVNRLPAVSTVGGFCLLQYTPSLIWRQAL